MELRLQQTNHQTISMASGNSETCNKPYSRCHEMTTTPHLPISCELLLDRCLPLYQHAEMMYYTIAHVQADTFVAQESLQCIRSSESC